MKNKTIIQKMEEERNNLLAQSKQLESVSKQLSDELKAMAKGVEVAMNIYAN